MKIGTNSKERGWIGKKEKLAKEKKGKTDTNCTGKGELEKKLIKKKKWKKKEK